MTLARTASLCLLLAIVGPTRPVAAHVGSPDVFFDGRAGPYHVYVTVRPPVVIPGVADVEILAVSSGVRSVRIVPTPLAGAAAKFAPTPDLAVQGGDEPRRFSGQLWMMSAGAWQVRVIVEGADGTGAIAVPVPTLPQSTAGMGRALGSVLFASLAVLCVGIVSIVSAIAREASLAPGELPTPRARRRGWIAAAVAVLLVAAIVTFGRWWWTVEASSYARYVYKPLTASAATTPDGRLTLTVRDPGWIALRRLDDFVADHGHLMHLFVVSPALDRLWHLHPRHIGEARFEQQLPPMNGGEYEFFADVVHRTGIAETVAGRLEIGDMRGAPLSDDDSGWTGLPTRQPSRNDTVSWLPDGGRMTWIRPEDALRPGQLTIFTFRVDDRDGRPASDLDLYMGMPGHAIFVRHDRRVFAHVHPSGSAPMATIEMGQRSLVDAGLATASVHDHERDGLAPMISFPYGFPAAGDYRIFVQVKRGGQVATGVFDAHVE
jgi:hypothetical protein